MVGAAQIRFSLLTTCPYFDILNLTFLMKMVLSASLLRLYCVLEETPWCKNVLLVFSFLL